MIQGDGYVIVESGDYLGKIASRVGVSVPKLQEMNGIANPDYIHVGQKIKTKDEIQEQLQEEPVAEEPKKTTKEKVNEQREETKDEDVKVSKETQCCPVIAPWKVLEFDEKGKKRSYELEVAEEVITNDGEKVSREVVSKGQKVSEHNLYMVAPSLDGDGNPQTKEIEVDFTFIKNPCAFTMFVKNKTLSKRKEIETGEEDVAKKAKFIIDTEGNIEGSYDYVEPLKKVEKYTTSQYQSNATLGGVDSASEVKRIDSEISMYQSLNDPYAFNKIAQLEVERMKYESMILTHTHVQMEGELEPYLIRTFIKELTGHDFRPKALEIFPKGSKVCDLQPKVKLFIDPYLSIDGFLEITASTKHTLDASETQYEDDKKTGARKVVNKVKPNDKVKINRSYCKFVNKVNITYGTFNRKHDSETKVYGKLSNNLESKNPQTVPKHNPSSTKVVKHKDANEMFTGFQKRINEFYGTLASGQKGWLKYDLGKTGFKLHAKKWKYVEDDTTHLCGYVGRFEATVFILHGANIGVGLDLVEIIENSTGTFTKKIKEWKEELKSSGIEANAKLEAFLGIEAGVKGTVSWGREKVSDRYELKDRIEGHIGLKVEATVEASVSILSLKGEAGANFKVASKKSKLIPSAIKVSVYPDIDKDGNVSWSGKIDFTGLTLYYMAFARLKISKDSSVNVEGISNRNNKKNKDTKSNTELFKTEHKGHQDLLQPCNLFDAMGIKPIKREAQVDTCASLIKQYF